MFRQKVLNLPLIVFYVSIEAYFMNLLVTASILYKSLPEEPFHNF